MMTTHHKPTVEERIDEEAAHKVMISMSEGRWKLLMWGFGLHFTVGMSAITFLAGWVKGNSSDIADNSRDIAALTESVRGISASLNLHIQAQDKTMSDLSASIQGDLNTISLSLRELKIDLKSIETTLYQTDKRMSIMEGNRYTSADAVKGQQTTDARMVAVEAAINRRIDDMSKAIKDISDEIRMLHGPTPKP